MTESGFVIDLCQFLGKVLAQQAAGDGFEVIRNHRRRSLWIHLQQEMNMISLTVHLNQLPAPRNAQVVDDLSQTIKHRSRKTLAAIFRDKNEMVTKRVSTVVKLVNIDFVHCLTIISYMEFVQRKITYRLYPNAAQADRMTKMPSLSGWHVLLCQKKQLTLHST